MCVDRGGDLGRKVAGRNRTIVKHHWSSSQVPQRRSLHLNARRLAIGNAVGERAHVVKEEIGVDAHGLVANRALECGIVGREKLRGVTLDATDCVEDRFTSHAAAGRLRRRSEVALKCGDARDEGDAELVGLVFDFGNAVAIG